MLFGILKRALAYLLIVVVALMSFVAAALLGAKVAPNFILLTVGAFSIFFGAIFVCTRFVERKSTVANSKALVMATLLTAVLGGGLWIVAGTPGEARAEPQTPTQYWTLGDGARIAYQRCGEALATTTPVVFLHGGPAIPPRQSSVDTVCALGAAGLSVYVYDQIGSGRSSRLTDVSGYTLARHVEDLEAIRLQLGVEQFDIIGVSWGTVLASHYIARYPGRVRRAVYVSPGILGSRDDIDYDFSASASSDFDGVVLPPARIIVAGLLARANPRLATQFMPEAEAAAAMDILALNPSLEYQGRCKGAEIQTGGSRGVGANYYANLVAAQSLRRDQDPTAAIAATAPPALMIHGVCDYIPRSALKRYQAAYPNNSIIDVENAGHSLLGSRADVVLPAATCWLTQKDVERCRAREGSQPAE